MERDKKISIVMAAVGFALTELFLLFEWVLYQNGVFGEGTQMTLIDVACRLGFGIVAISVLAGFYRKRFGGLFTHSVSRITWILLTPVWLNLLSYGVYLIPAESVTGEFAGIFLMVCVQQLATGFLEEATARGVMMSGFLGRKDRLSFRLAAVIGSGVIFGLAHVTNFLFGGDIVESLWQGLFTAAWGMFMAAIYLVSENLGLMMALHALWDIVVRVPGNFINLPGGENGLLIGLDVFQTAIELVVMPVMAVLICVNYDKWTSGSRTTAAK